jgi:hypothetical protein
VSHVAILLPDDNTAFAPGQTIEALIAWELDEPPRELEARLFWYTEGMGAQDVEVVETQPIDGPPASGEESVTFRAPPAPHSFSGKLISLIWAIELVAEPGGHTARQELVIAPEGVEIDLYAHQTTPVADEDSA